MKIGRLEVHGACLFLFTRMNLRTIIEFANEQHKAFTHGDIGPVTGSFQRVARPRLTEPLQGGPRGCH